MSRDIRSFFLPKKDKVQTPKVEIDDDDVIPESPDVQIKTKKREARKKRVLSDSDDEIFSTKKPKAESPSKSKSKKKSPSKPELKEVKAVDLFGNSKIKRSEPLVKKEKKKTETGIHSDEEFDKSLLELDAIAESEELKSPIRIRDENRDEKCNNAHKNVPEGTSSSKKLKVDEPKETIKISREEKEKNGHADFLTPDRKAGGKGKKRDFSEFLDNSHHSNNSAENTDVESDTKKKKKMNKSLNESVLTDEERHERKQQSAALYKSYLNRSGPKHLGAKEIPEGAPNCLSNCAFLLTGVLDSFERDEIAAAISKYGGTMKNSISKKVTHVLAGEEAGPAKMAKAEELGIKILNEDEFLQMIKDSNGKIKDSKGKSEPKDIKKEKSPKIKEKSSSEKKSREKETQKIKKESGNGDVKVKMEKNKGDKKVVVEESTLKLDNSSHSKESKSEIVKEINIKDEPRRDNVNKKSEEKSKPSTTQAPTQCANAMMWVEKYKPQNVKQIIGQHGDASNVKKLSNWLTKWYLNRKAKIPKPSPWAKNDDGAFYKAVLLSGPPGVGKTTTVSLVCKELGFDMVEFNASDTRNKTLIKQQIGELLTTTSLSGYAKGDTGKQAVTKKHALVMDEVDGMAGNEDRGGLQELIGLIKTTSVPIICMCNDRNSQKMRSLVNYCYDLRFSKPRVDQIKSALMSICFKEGVKVPPETLTELIVASNQDVRQSLNLLSLYVVEPQSGSKRVQGQAAKDVRLGPWEAIRKVFSAEDHKTMSIADKSDLFFADYSLAPLFVQENYLRVVPHCPKESLLSRLSAAADSISLGDLVDARIRRSQAWGLLPTQAMYSSVIPGHALSGHVGGQIQFPGWLGKNSRAGKMQRLCQEIHAHTRLSTSGSKSSIFLDYARHLRDAITSPLVSGVDGVTQTLAVLEDYHLLREDLDSLVELSVWPGQRNPMDLIDPKVKAAMTRTYNKKATALPYAPGAVRRGRGREDAGEGEGEEGDEDEVDEDSDPENDALIKKKKPEKASNSKERAGSSKDKPSTSKEQKKPSANKEKKKKK